jgi:hypothetical protein
LILALTLAIAGLGPYERHVDCGWHESPAVKSLSTVIVFGRQGPAVHKIAWSEFEPTREAI